MTFRTLSIGDWIIVALLIVILGTLWSSLPLRIVGGVLLLFVVFWYRE